MIELMKFYIFHKTGPRVAFPMNSAAANILIAWLSSLMFIVGGLIAQIYAGKGTINAYFMFLVGASYYYYPEAKRIHNTRKAGNNKVLFCEQSFNKLLLAPLAGISVSCAGYGIKSESYVKSNEN